MKKYLAEMIGTFVLVAMAVGVAAITGGELVPTALAFGLALVAIIYMIGPISGAHVNPAVSIAFFVRRKMSAKDFCFYVIAQVVGAILGALFIFGLFQLMGQEWLVGSNGYEGLNPGNVTAAIFAGLLVEIVATFIFVLVIIMTVAKTNNKAIAGLVIGLTLALVHFFAIPLTGTSVNPARSLGPALFGGVDALRQVWLFIVAPLMGGVLAAIVSGFLLKGESEEETA